MICGPHTSVFQENLIINEGTGGERWTNAYPRCAVLTGWKLNRLSGDGGSDAEWVSVPELVISMLRKDTVRFTPLD